MLANSELCASIGSDLLYMPMKLWLLKWLVGSTTAATLLSPQVAPPPQIIETPVYISDSSATNEALSSLRSTYERKIQALTDKISKLERKVEDLEKRPPVERIIPSSVPPLPPVSSSQIDIASNFSRFDKQLASLEGRVGLYETSYIKLNEAYDKIKNDFDIFTATSTVNLQIKRLCFWHWPNDPPKCQGLWW